MSVRNRDGEKFCSLRASSQNISGKSLVTGLRWRAFLVLAALTALTCGSGMAQVPTAPGVPPALAVPSVPTDYCGSLYGELKGDLDAFNTQLTTTTPSWTPVSLGPTINALALAWANADSGPQIGNPGYEQTVQAQLQEVKALGAQGVSLPILFPVLYEPFYGSQTAYQPYLNFYIAVAQAVRAAGLKLIVDDEIAFSNDIQAGWTNMNTFYASLTWPEYVAARASMAATIEQYIQPDFLSVANEPDTEAVQTGQSNLNNPADAAAMVQAEITAVQAYLAANPSVTPPKLGAGFGTWMGLSGTSSLGNYISAYVTLPLDYIDFHVIPVNTVGGDNFLQNALTVASAAATAGKAVAIGQAWLGKASAAEQAGGYSVSDIDVQRARQTFSFWQPLDIYYTQVMEELASYTGMAYFDLYDTWFISAYQTYGGTTANGGSTNCTCVTTSTSPFYDCSDYDIMQFETSLAGAADTQSVYSDFSFGYHSLLLSLGLIPPDTTTPAQPAGLALGSIGYTTANLTWNANAPSDNVAGYAVFRCNPAPCTPVWIANTTLPGYTDTSLTSGTSYDYQIQAFDFVNHFSPLSATVPATTYATSASSATNLLATAASPSQINLGWTAPANQGTTTYSVYAGLSLGGLLKIAGPITATTYTVTSLTPTTTKAPLTPETTYYFGIVAAQQGIQAPMSNAAYATTLPLLPPPSNVTGTATSATKVSLSWQENILPNNLPILNYNIYEGTTPGSYIKIPTPPTSTATTFSVSGLSPNTTYYFEVVADDTGHDISTPSDQIAVNTWALPAVPTNVAATANSATSVTVTWSEVIPTNGMPIATYTVLRGPSSTGPWGTVGTVSAKAPAQPATQYTDKTAAANTTYYYAVEATDTGHDPITLPSIAAEVTTYAEPVAPTNVVATANSETQITVTWSEVPPPNGMTTFSSYTVFRSQSSTGPWGSALGTVGAKPPAQPATKYIDKTAAQNTTYYYAVEATDSGQDPITPMSAASNAVTTAVAPAVPTSVTVTTNSETQLTVTWSEQTNPLPPALPIASYTINWGTTSSLGTSVTRTTQSFVATGLKAGSPYYFAVEATDSGGDKSAWTATVSGTTAVQPAAPVIGSIVSNTAGTQLTVNWTENLPPANMPPIVSYTINWGTTPALGTSVKRTASPFLATGLTPGTTYYFAVTATDKGGDNSLPSATASGTTQ